MVCKRAVIAICVVAALLVLPACPSGGSSPAPAGESSATVAYWNELHAPYLPADAFELMSSITSEPEDPASRRNIVALMRESSDLAKSRCGQIADLSVTGVDAEVTEFVAQCLKVRLEGIAVGEARLQAVEEATSTFEPDALAFSFLLSLAAHANEEDAAFRNAFMEQLSEKAGAAQQLKSRGDALMQRIRALSEAAEQLRADEVALRGRLTARYGSEFPAGNTYPKTVAPAGGSTDASALTREVLARDLIGHKIGSGSSVWTFDSPKEFRTFDVTASTVKDGVARFDIATHVKGLISGAEHDFNVRMTYRHRDGEWRLFSVSDAAR